MEHGTPLADHDSAREATRCPVAVTSMSYRRGDTMMTKILLLLAALSLGSVALTGCNTVQGAGKDVEKAGQKVQDEAQEHKRY